MFSLGPKAFRFNQLYQTSVLFSFEFCKNKLRFFIKKRPITIDPRAESTKEYDKLMSTTGLIISSESPKYGAETKIALLKK